MRGAEQLRYKFVCAIRRATDIGTLIPGILHADSGVTPGTYYVHNNHRGDVIITRSGTTTVGVYEYSAFGNLKSSIGSDVCRFKFSSKELDRATGFNYYGYRFYAPQWQRWISRDPLGELGFETIRHHHAAPLGDSHNPYIFVYNTPTDVKDPLGLRGLLELCG